MMAKPKKSVIVKILTGFIVHVWASEMTEEEVLSVEGITQVLSSSALPWLLLIDARYDINEVVAELEEFLISKTPEAFYDETDSPD